MIAGVFLSIDKTYVFSYNNSWKDQLTKLTVNGVAEEFEYDNIGLPTKYRNQPMAWNNRNLLADYKNVLFTYDGTGMRLAKSTYVEIIDDDGTKRREITGTTTFDYEGDRLLSESRNGAIIRYIYGASGMLGFVYKNSNYYFVRNLQGDVTRIVDANNQIVAQYVYDAWGNCTIVSETNGIGTLNAIRYRGYYFDSETGLYYLQTRYYDPEIGRFISPDSTKYLDPETLGGLNLYAYCNNNPVMYADPSGNIPRWLKTGLVVLAGIAVIAGITAVTLASGGLAAPVLFGAGLGTLLSGGVSAAMQFISTGSINWDKVIIDATVGGVMGAFGASAISQYGMSIAGATTGFVSSIAEDWVEGSQLDLIGALYSALLGGLFAFKAGAGKQYSSLLDSIAIKDTMHRISTQSGSWTKGLKKIYANRLNDLRHQIISDVKGGVWDDVANNCTSYVYSFFI